MAPSILAVTSELPWPLDSGGHLRSFHLLRALSRRFQVRLVAGALPGQEAHVDALRRAGIDIRPAWLTPRSLVREAVRAAAAAVHREPYVMFRRHNRSAIRAALRAELEAHTPDALYLDHLDSLQFASVAPAAPVVLDLHNVYSVLARRVADDHRLPGRLYLRREAALLERMERKAARTAAMIAAVSSDDADYFNGLGARHVSIVPNGVDCAAYEALPIAGRSGPFTIAYVGVLSWPPNAAAAMYLATTVLPAVRARIPQARLRIIGRQPPRELQALSGLEGVEVTGAVPDMIEHLRAAHVLAVPLDAGGGTRLKILEAFAAGLPVISTAIGCEGLPVRDGDQLIVAERERFADAIVDVWRRRDVAEHIARRARRLARDRYDWTSVGESLCASVSDHVFERTSSASRIINREENLHLPPKGGSHRSTPSVNSEFARQIDSGGFRL